MLANLIIVDDDSDAFSRIKRAVKDQPQFRPIEVDPKSPYEDTLAKLEKLDRENNLKSVYILIDRYMPDMRTGEYNSRSGEAFATYLLKEKYPKKEWLLKRVFLYSAHSSKDPRLVIAERKVPFIAKAQLGEFLETKLIPRVIQRWERHHAGFAEADWCLRDENIRKEHAGRTLAVTGNTIWGIGERGEEAVKVAMRVPGCPPVNRLVLVTMPPEGPAIDFDRRPSGRVAEGN